MNRPALIACLVLAGTAARADQAVRKAGVDGKAVIDRFYRQQKIHGNEAGFRIRDVVLDQQVTTFSRSGTDSRRYAIFLLQSDVSIALFRDKLGDPLLFLTRGKESWLYKKGLHAPLKVSQGYQVASSVSLFDVLRVRFDEYSLDAHPDSLPPSAFRMRAISPAMPYAALVVSVDSATRDIAAIEYLGTNGRSIRRANLTEYASVGDGHRFPKWSLRNTLFNTGDSAQIRYVGVRREKLPGSLFYPNTQSLDRFLKQYQSGHE